jgi:hypothetical protein
VTNRTAGRLAWSLCAGCVAGSGGLLVLKALNVAADLRSAALIAAPLAFSVVVVRWWCPASDAILSGGSCWPSGCS